MGKDSRPWRKLVKKLRRKRIRQKLAMERDAKESYLDFSLIDPSLHFKRMELQEIQKLQEEEEKMKHEAEEQKWIDQEIQAQLEYKMEMAKQKRLATIKADEEKKIREEWEQRQQKEKELQAEKDRLEKELKEKQVIIGVLYKEEEFNTFISFLSGDIETPPLPYVMPEEVDNGKETCSFFSRTGVCLFAEQCSRNHLRPTLSRTILIRNFFSNFSLEQSMLDEYDTDLGLEYEDTDMYKEFLEFYNDVLPEFRKIGKVIQFKVCCNFGMHLRGNVYIQYETIREAVNAYRKFNARFYNGKQLSLQFAKIDSWKSAICGLFLRKRCLKGKTCNFLHVFRNPTKEFVTADHDWKDNKNMNTNSRNPINLAGTEPLRPHKRSSSHSRGSGSRRCRSTERSSSHRHRSRSRNRSPRDRKRDSCTREKAEVKDRSSCKKTRRLTPTPSRSPSKHKHKKKTKKRSKSSHNKNSEDNGNLKIISEETAKSSKSKTGSVNKHTEADAGMTHSSPSKHKKSKKSKKPKKKKREQKNRD